MSFWPDFVWICIPALHGRGLHDYFYDVALLTAELHRSSKCKSGKYQLVDDVATVHVFTNKIAVI